MGVWYCTREAVSAALDVKVTARRADQIDRIVEDVSRQIEGTLHRRFYPWTGTRFFPWPAASAGTSWRLWLGEDELVSASAVVSGGVTIPAADYFLEPANAGPPYTRVEIDLSSAAAFTAGSTHQRNIAITGVYAGAPVEEPPAGALAEALDTSETGVDVTDSAAVGVGSVIRVDDERMTVTGKSMLDTGQDGSLTASSADQAMTVVSGAALHVGETLLIGSERVLVVDIAGNVVTVERAYDGSTLAAHVTADIYAPRTLTVARGALGTAAAAHSTAAPVTVWLSPVRTLAVAESVNLLEQESSAYARTVGSGETERNASGAGLADLRAQAYTRYGRKSRLGVV